jgi:hypothetical protein
MEPVKSIAEELVELRALDAHALATRFEELFGRPPRTRHREHLYRKCAYRVQELRLGGLSATAKRRIEALAAQVELPLDAPPIVTATVKSAFTPGTVISREWHGQLIEARVLDDGRFEYAGVPHRSLSALAKAVTGTHWNGMLFFGLKARKR